MFKTRDDAIKAGAAALCKKLGDGAHLIDDGGTDVVNDVRARWYRVTDGVKEAHFAVTIVSDGFVWQELTGAEIPLAHEAKEEELD